MQLHDLFEGNEQAYNWHSEPEQRSMDATRQARLYREREPEGSEAIDARIRARYDQLDQYNQSGRFWLKQKDTQEHISDAMIGKAAANAAAVELLKQRPELQGNLVITAYGPGESQGVTEMDKSAPQPGRDGRVSHSTYGSRDKGGSKGTEREARPITAKKAAQHALDILKKQGVAEGSGGVSVRQWANQVRKDHGNDVKFRNRQEGSGAVDSVIAKNSNGETVGVYNRKTGYPTVYEPNQGVAEGNDDVWGPQGNFAGDKPVNLGGSVSKRLDVDDTVTYFGEKATILAMSKDRSVSRIHLKSGITQNVKTSDLKRVEQGMAEAPGAETLGHNQSTVASNLNSLDLDEGDISQLEKDVAAAPVAPIANMEADEKIGGRHDPDDFDAMVGRLKKLAGAGPMKTVYDPNKRVYRNVPTAVQPAQQPKK